MTISRNLLTGSAASTALFVLSAMPALASWDWSWSGGSSASSSATIEQSQSVSAPFPVDPTLQQNAMIDLTTTAGDTTSRAWSSGSQTIHTTGTNAQQHQKLTAQASASETRQNPAPSWNWWDPPSWWSNPPTWWAGGINVVNNVVVKVQNVAQASSDDQHRKHGHHHHKHQKHHNRW